MVASLPMFQAQSPVRGGCVGERGNRRVFVGSVFRIMPHYFLIEELWFIGLFLGGGDFMTF